MTTTEKNGCAGRVHKTCRYNSTDGSKQDEIEANELLQELLKGPVKKKNVKNNTAFKSTSIE